MGSLTFMWLFKFMWSLRFEVVFFMPITDWYSFLLTTWKSLGLGQWELDGLDRISSDLKFHSCSACETWSMLSVQHKHFSTGLRIADNLFGCFYVSVHLGSRQTDRHISAQLLCISSFWHFYLNNICAIYSIRRICD